MNVMILLQRPTQFPLVVPGISTKGSDLTGDFMLTDWAIAIPMMSKWVLHRPKIGVSDVEAPASRLDLIPNRERITIFDYSIGHLRIFLGQTCHGGDTTTSSVSCSCNNCSPGSKPEFDSIYRDYFYQSNNKSAPVNLSLSG